MVLVLEGGYLEYRDFNSIYERVVTGSRVKGLQCRNDQILYVTDDDKVVMIDLDHKNHISGKLSFYAALLFAVFMSGLLAYFLLKEKKKGEKTHLF